MTTAGDRAITKSSNFKDGNLDNDSYTTIEAGDIFAHGRLVYWWGPDGQWKHIQNRANDYAGSYTTGGPSDGRLKTALRPIDNALNKISRLKGISFRWGESGLEYLTREVVNSVSAGPGATAEENQRLREQERRKGG